MRRCDIQNGSVNSIICNARPATNPKRMVVGNEVSIVGSGSIQGQFFMNISIQSHINLNHWGFYQKNIYELKKNLLNDVFS